MVVYKANHIVKYCSQDLTIRSIREVFSLVKVESSLF